MPPELLSFLEKLPTDNSTYKLEWQGLKIDKKYFELKTRLSELTHAQLLSLAILLQHLNLNLFTDDELGAVADLDLTTLSVTNCPKSNKKTLTNQRQLFDTESTRIYSFIDISSITNNSKNQIIANYLDFNNNNLQEIIIKLYTKGI